MMRKLVRRRKLDSSGMSLTELLISMSIFSVLMAIVFSILITVTYQARDSLARAQAVQQARLGVSQIDRQVRSGNLIANPALEDPDDSGVPAYFSLRIFTQEDNDPKCAQWRVIDHNGDKFYDLEFRSWDPSYLVGDDYDPWTVVAQNVVVPTTIDLTQPAGWPPFFVDNAALGLTDAHFVRITLRLQGPDADPQSRPATVTTVVTGRNTVFGYPTSSCSNIPDPG
jgi:prepilin-type N-terminal cleavage/methylation domain-containing protein